MNLYDYARMKKKLITRKKKRKDNGLNRRRTEWEWKWKALEGGLSDTRLK